MNAKQKGNLTELQCICAFYSLGYHVCIPYGEDSRYDFIADIEGKLKRIQVKTAKENEDGSIEFSCRSTRVNSTGSIHRKYTKEEIDYFATYYNNICYLIPVEECSGTKTLRFVETKNNQKTKINLASEYEIDKIIKKM